MEIISSKSNDIIKYAQNLKTKKYCAKYGECLVESEKVVHDLIKSNKMISTILVNEKKKDRYEYITNSFTGKIVYITDALSNYLCDTVTSSGIFAFAKVPENKIKKDNFIVLENLQDPSNLGAIIRSARAFNYNNIIVIGGVFPYNYKVIRSSMGYVFDVNIVEMSYEDLSEYVKRNNLLLYCADMDGFDVSETPSTSCNFGFVIGNEGNGVSLQMKNMCNSVVSIPMQNKVESLNASVSASIIMYMLNKINKEKK